MTCSGIIWLSLPKEAFSNAQDKASILLEAAAMTGGILQVMPKKEKKSIRFLRTFWFEEGLY